MLEIVARISSEPRISPYFERWLVDDNGWARGVRGSIVPGWVLELHPESNSPEVLAKFEALCPARPLQHLEREELDDKTASELLKHGWYEPKPPAEPAQLGDDDGNDDAAIAALYSQSHGSGSVPVREVPGCPPEGFPADRTYRQHDFLPGGGGG